MEGVITFGLVSIPAILEPISELPCDPGTWKLWVNGFRSSDEAAAIVGGVAPICQLLPSGAAAQRPYSVLAEACRRERVMPVGTLQYSAVAPPCVLTLDNGCFLLAVASSIEVASRVAHARAGLKRCPINQVEVELATQIINGMGVGSLDVSDREQLMSLYQEREGLSLSSNTRAANVERSEDNVVDLSAAAERRRLSLASS